MDIYIFSKCLKEVKYTLMQYIAPFKNETMLDLYKRFRPCTWPGPVPNFGVTPEHPNSRNVSDGDDGAF